MAKIRHCTELQHGPTIELFPGLQTNSTDRTNSTDEDVPTLEHVYESAFGRPMPERIRAQLNSSADMDVDADGVPIPTYEHIRKQILGR